MKLLLLVKSSFYQTLSSVNFSNVFPDIIWQSMLKLRFQRWSWAAFHGRPDFNEFEKFCDEASAHMLIEEAMITCNSCCSHFLQKKVRIWKQKKYI